MSDFKTIFTHVDPDTGKQYTAEANSAKEAIKIFNLQKEEEKKQEKKPEQKEEIKTTKSNNQ